MSSPSLGAFTFGFNLLPPVGFVGVAPKLVGPLATIHKPSKDYHHLIIIVSSSMVVSS